LGHDTITARNLFEREFQFIPVFKLFMNTNYLPLIQDDTVFSSGRMKVISFDKHFTPEEQDPTLKQRLITPENLSGVLNWCLQGLKEFQAQGLEPPEAVNNATDSYRI